jgi:hypothetical protein
MEANADYYPCHQDPVAVPSDLPDGHATEADGDDD